MHALGPLATDLYQLTMAAGYFARGHAAHVATCELFVRRLPQARRYLVAMGIDLVLDYLEALRFEEEDIRFLRSVPALAGAISDDFAEYLRRFRFSGDVDSVAEGTIVFAHEPLLRVRAPIIEAQIIETFALSVINHATMIASKAARVVQAAAGRGVVEFGTRRTHPAAALDATRAAYACGFSGTSNVEAARRYGIPVLGTAAHMWTMAHSSEEEAFQSYFEVFPGSTILLIDTYDTPRGARRAAKVAKDKLVGVRLDSGDLGALAREVRAILDQQGAPQAKIVASGDLNEHSIAKLLADGAPIDTFGVGTELVCSVDAPSLGGVYKLVELDDGKQKRAIAKFSAGKGTLPGSHQVARSASPDGAISFDTILLADEPAPAGTSLLLSPAFAAGRRVRPAAPLGDVRSHVAAGLASLPARLRPLTPHESDSERYEVGLSPALAALRDQVRDQFVYEGER